MNKHQYEQAPNDLCGLTEYTYVGANMKGSHQINTG